MITAKFGGTALAPQNFGCVKQLVGKHHGCVVVSAVGKEFLGDIKTTDLLKMHFLGDETAWQRVEQKYKRLVLANGVNVDVEQLLHNAKVRSLQSLPVCMSLGEELAAKITAAFLQCAYVEAEQCIAFRPQGSLNVVATKNNLKSAFSGVELGVVGGFYGGSANGRLLFPRGGSDVTGSICAVALGSSLYENWTDANGVCVANPKFVSNAQTLPNLSYGQMFRMAQSGAEVLHPTAVRVAQRAGVSIMVANYLNNGGFCTLVGNCPSSRAFLSVAEKCVGGKIITTVLHSMEPADVSRRLQQVCQEVVRVHGQSAFCMRCKNICTLSHSDATITSSCSILPIVHNVFSY